MNLLSIESATDVCSVAILLGGEMASTLSIQKPRAHAERLVPMISECLDEASMKATDMDVVALSAGPGSYTGLRIGAATAKGLIFATGAKLCAVSTIEALVWPLMTESSTPLVAMLPSRRGEVYLAAWFPQGDGSFEPCLAPTIVSESELIRCLSDSKVEGGRVAVPSKLPSNSADIVAVEALARPIDSLVAGIGILEATHTFDVRPVPVSAENVARCSLPMVDRELFADASTFEPYYMRAFEARKPSRSVFDRLPF